jgi:hypothetical protein
MMTFLLKANENRGPVDLQIPRVGHPSQVAYDRPKATHFRVPRYEGIFVLTEDVYNPLGSWRSPMEMGAFVLRSYRYRAAGYLYAIRPMQNLQQTGLPAGRLR